jgi:hypothetical protein
LQKFITGTPMGDDNPSGVQRRIVAAMRRKMVQIADGIKAEIEN